MLPLNDTVQNLFALDVVSKPTAYVAFVFPLEDADKERYVLISRQAGDSIKRSRQLAIKEVTQAQAGHILPENGTMLDIGSSTSFASGRAAQTVRFTKGYLLTASDYASVAGVAEADRSMVSAPTPQKTIVLVL